jgi:VanZ family protein
MSIAFHHVSKYIEENQKVASIASLVLCLAAIFYLSSLPSFTQGDGFSFELVVRKLGHFFEYFTLAGCIFWVGIVFRIPLHPALLLAFFGATLYAVTDEIHQLFVYGRHGTLTDVYIDMFGALIMCWLLSNDAQVERKGRVFGFMKY